ncbi:MAG: hypothetical protein AB7J40_00210 [Candidatus Altimarinota bacterium]
MGSFSLAPAAMHLHLIFVGITLVGGILFLSWALKMKVDELKRWTLWLLVVGILGVLLTSAFSGFGWKMKKMTGGMMHGEEMEMMMKNGKMGSGGMMQNR